MKKSLSIILILVLTVVSISPSATKADSVIATECDGYYIVELHEEHPEGDTSVRGFRYFVKTLSRYSSDGQKEWEMKLHGSFSFDGTSATCTDASVTYSIYNSNWHFVSKSAWPSGNTANGTITLKETYLGFTLQTVTKSLTITCDADGNVS